MPISKLVYVDADVCISYFDGTAGRAHVIDEVFAEARRGNIQLITSTLTITETAFVARERTAGLDGAVEAEMDQLWNDRSVLTLVEPSILIARRARDIMRHAVSLKLKMHSMDALHLASAELHGATELFTYNFKDFRNFETLTRVHPCEPYTAQGRIPGIAP